jgi:hypothetical protein
MNILTEKLAGRNNIDLVKSGLLPKVKELNCCIYIDSCPDIKKLMEEPDGDLSDQYYELCTHPSEEARKMSCLIYNDFENISWKDMSTRSRTVRKSHNPYFFVKSGGIK